MNSTRRILLWASSLVALGLIVLLWRSQQQLVRLSDATIRLDARAEARRAAIDEMETALASLKSYLLEVQRHVPPPDNYDEWSKQQRRNRDAVHLLRQRTADLQTAPPDAEAFTPELATALGRIGPVASDLLTRWTEYDRMGTGLTRKSEVFAVETLLPLVAEDLEPALNQLRPALKADTEHAAAALPDEIAAARHLRLIAGFGLLASLAFGAGIVVLARLAPPSASLVQQARHRLVVTDQPSPVAAPAAVDHPARTATLSPDIPRLLIAEQNHADGETLSILLSGAGYGIFFCDNTAAALAALRAMRFHLVLLDQQMPGTADLLQEAHRSAAPTPVLLLVSTDNAASSSPFASQVIAGIVRKPIDPQALIQTVTAIVPPAPGAAPAKPPVAPPAESAAIEPPPAPVADFSPPSAPPPLPAPMPPAPPEPQPQPALSAPAVEPAQPDLAVPPLDPPGATTSSPLRKRLVRKRVSGGDEPPASPPPAT